MGFRTGDEQSLSGFQSVQTSFNKCILINAFVQLIYLSFYLCVHLFSVAYLTCNLTGVAGRIPRGCGLSIPLQLRDGNHHWETSRSFNSIVAESTLLRRTWIPLANKGSSRNHQNKSLKFLSYTIQKYDWSLRSRSDTTYFCRTI